MTMIGHPEHKAIRPLKKTIKSAAARSEDAAKEVKETEGGERDQNTPPEPGSGDENCGTCGEGIEGNETGRRSATRVGT